MTFLVFLLLSTPAFACSSSGNPVISFFSITPFLLLILVPFGLVLVAVKWGIYRFGFGLKAFGRLALLHLLPVVIAGAGGALAKLMQPSGAGSVSGTRLPVPEETSVWTDLLSRGLFVVVPVVILVLLYKGEKTLFEKSGITGRGAVMTSNILNFIYAVLLGIGGIFVAMAMQC